jgi:hypothetical protein
MDHLHHLDAVSAFAGALSIVNYGYVTPSFIDPSRAVEVIFAASSGVGEPLRVHHRRRGLHGHQQLSGLLHTEMGDVPRIRAPHRRLSLQDGGVGIHHRIVHQKTRCLSEVAMINTIAYGHTIGAIIYIISIGLSLTFGTMRIVNFAHGFDYTIWGVPAHLVASLRA